MNTGYAYVLHIGSKGANQPPLLLFTIAKANSRDDAEAANFRSTWVLLSGVSAVKPKATLLDRCSLASLDLRLSVCRLSVA